MNVVLGVLEKFVRERIDDRSREGMGTEERERIKE
jgi:hypothetical protein